MVLAGVVGALLAVPVVAVANAMTGSLHSDRPTLIAEEMDTANPAEASPPR